MTGTRTHDQQRRNIDPDRAAQGLDLTPEATVRAASHPERRDPRGLNRDGAHGRAARRETSRGPAFQEGRRNALPDAANRLEPVPGERMTT